MNSLLQEILNDCRRYIKDGNVANYIPELAKTNTNEFGVCVMTENNMHLAGDTACQTDH
ncbi:MAG: glutaminase [Clostridia bacterium]|nr:glutaminase [Clostridia bacterium]